MYQHCLPLRFRNHVCYLETSWIQISPFSAASSLTFPVAHFTRVCLFQFFRQIQFSSHLQFFFFVPHRHPCWLNIASWLWSQTSVTGTKSGEPSLEHHHLAKGSVSWVCGNSSHHPPRPLTNTSVLTGSHCSKAWAKCKAGVNTATEPQPCLGSTTENTPSRDF